MEIVDPGESARDDLDALDAARSKANIDGTLPKSPLWYAVPMATSLIAIALFDGGDRSLWWLVLAMAAFAVLGVHYFGTIRIIPRRSRRTIAVNLVTFIVVWAALTGVSVLASIASGTDGFFTLMVACWLGAIVFFTARIALMNHRRDRALRP